MASSEELREALARLAAAWPREAPQGEARRYWAEELIDLPGGYLIPAVRSLIRDPDRRWLPRIGEIRGRALAMQDHDAREVAQRAAQERREAANALDLTAHTERARRALRAQGIDPSSLKLSDLSFRLRGVS
jgi:hypothetical protein